MAINVKLLRKVQKHILAEPKRFLMSAWKIKGEPGERKSLWCPDGLEPDVVTLPACGTVACIAGWTCLLGGKERATNIERNAGKLIGIPQDSWGENNDYLFLVEYWPKKFRTQYNNAKTFAARVKIAVARIDHFIATKGAE